jgi:hypothetical protein
MDQNGNIYDMQGTYIGTANTNDLVAMEDDGSNPNNLLN